MKFGALVLFVCVVAFVAETARVPLRRFVGLRPEVLAQNLLATQDEWWQQAVAFTDCRASANVVACSNLSESFDLTCTTITSAVIQQVNGDRDAAKKYMDNVCGSAVLTGWHTDRCRSLAAFLNDAMVEDCSENLGSQRAGDFCRGFWWMFLNEEKDQIAKKRSADAQRALDDEALEEVRNSSVEELAVNALGHAAQAALQLAKHLAPSQEVTPPVGSQTVPPNAGDPVPAVAGQQTTSMPPLAVSRRVIEVLVIFFVMAILGIECCGRSKTPTPVSYSDFPRRPL